MNQHLDDRVTDAIRATGALLIFLPTYSPEWNPVFFFFALIVFLLFVSLHPFYFYIYIHTFSYHRMHVQLFFVVTVNFFLSEGLEKQLLQAQNITLFKNFVLILNIDFNIFS